MCVTLLALCASCDQSGEKANGSPAAPGSREAGGARDIRKGNGLVRGRVTFVGTPPVMKEIANDHCRPDAPTLKEETVIVGANGGLKNVMVSIEGLGAMDGSSLPPARLDQVNCRYVPHVLGLCAGQTLTVTSADPTLHNVQFAGTLNRAQNFGMTQAGATRDVTTLTNPEVVPVRCDVHPWMLAYVVVTENPFFAVTGDDGTFEIKNLPPGDYKLVAWHERYGRLEQPVSVTNENEKPLDVKFDYKQ